MLGRCNRLAEEWLVLSIGQAEQETQGQRACVMQTPGVSLPGQDKDGERTGGGGGLQKNIQDKEWPQIMGLEDRVI